MKYFKLCLYLNLYLIPLIMLINVNTGNSQEAIIEEPTVVEEPILSLEINIHHQDPNSPSDSFPPSFLCEVFSKWGPSATAESLVTLFRWIRQNDNRSFIEKFIGENIISKALQQDCGGQNTPLHRAIQSGTQLVDAINLIVRSEPSSLRKRNSEGQTPAMVLRDRLTSSHPVTHEDLDILLLLEGEQAYLEDERRSYR